MWAEEFGLGELGLMPDQFWPLTVREFWIKHAAWVREDDRRRAFVFELAQLLERDGKRRDRIVRAVNQLRRYPIKRWLLAKPEAS